jgi:hypothetical protein
MTYDELAQFAASMPRIPKWELKCHPMVIAALRWETQAFPARKSMLYNVYDMLACPVYEDPLMEPGAWEIHKDGELHAAGNIDRPDEPIVLVK